MGAQDEVGLQQDLLVLAKSELQRHLVRAALHRPDLERVAARDLELDRVAPAHALILALD